MNYEIKESVRTLLGEIVDYAGLFPPSQFSMADAVVNYATYKSSDYRWMLGRFVVPVSRLEEFGASANDFLARDAGDAWHLSVLAGEDIRETVRQIENFNAEYEGRSVCDALEIKADYPAVIEEAADVIPRHIQSFFELPLGEELAEMVTTLALYQQSAKIRTGGVTAQAFPPIRSIIRFIRVCLAANVPFKATAGLHHPVRCLKPLTYESDAPQGMMNGFLNLFLATAFARAGFKPSLLEEIMEDEFAENFEFEDGGVWWRQEHFLNTAQLKITRARNIISFGSCSFDEPVEDLREIGLL